jgi:nucleoside-diphosphate-sugar epimerase
MSNILITGATSFVGINLINKLYKDNQIFAVIRPHSKNTFKLEKFSNIKIIECDMDSSSSLLSFLSMPIDYAYLLAWRGVRGEERYNSEIQKQDYDDTLVAYDSLVKAGTKNIITIGSQAEFGDFSKPANYKTVPHPTNPYGFFKLKVFETLSQKSLHDHVNYKHGRIFSSYGPGDSSNTLIYYLISEFLNNHPVNLTKCVQLWDFIYIEDCADAIIRIGQYGKNCHPYSIGTGDIHPLKDYVEIIRSFFKDTVINYGAIDYKNNQPMFLGADISDLEKDTGFVPKIAFKDGINKMINYTKEKEKHYDR